MMKYVATELLKVVSWLKISNADVIQIPIRWFHGSSFKGFSIVFLLPDWLKLNHLKSRMECDIFSRHICSTIAETISVTNYAASFGAKNVQKITFEAAEMMLGPWNQQHSIIHVIIIMPVPGTLKNWKKYGFIEIDFKPCQFWKLWCQSWKPPLNRVLPKHRHCFYFFKVTRMRFEMISSTKSVCLPLYSRLLQQAQSLSAKTYLSYVIIESLTVCLQRTILLSSIYYLV